MVSELIASLSNYSGGEDVVHYAQFTHYAPLFRQRGDIKTHCLKTLTTEEFRSVKNED